MTQPDLTTLAGQKAHYAAVHARLWGPPPRVRYQWHKPALVEIWSKPLVQEIFVTDEARIAGIIAALGNKRRVIDVIMQTAEQCGVFAVDLLRRSRNPTLCHYRMIAMAIAHAVTGKSFCEIGRHFGNRHHTTIISACEKYSALVERAMML